MTDLMQRPAFEPPPAPRPRRKPWYRQAYLIVPLVLFVVAAAAVTTTVLLEMRNDSASVNISAPPPTATPLHVTATSALNGESLAVILTLPDGAQLPVAKNEAVATDRVKPGDQVGVSAEGYVATQAPVGTDRTITVTLQPMFATVGTQLLHWDTDRQDDKIINLVLSPATGLQYKPLPRTSDDSSIAADVGDHTIVNIILSRGVSVNQEFLKQMYGNTAQQITIAGQPAWHGSMGQGAVGTTWVHDPLLIDVNGGELSTTDKVMAGIVAALPAS